MRCESCGEEVNSLRDPNGGFFHRSNYHRHNDTFFYREGGTFAQTAEVACLSCGCVYRLEQVNQDQFWWRLTDEHKMEALL